MKHIIRFFRLTLWLVIMILLVYYVDGLTQVQIVVIGSIMGLLCFAFFTWIAKRSE